MGEPAVASGAVGSASTPGPWRDAAARGLAATRVNRQAGLVLWALAGALVAGFYGSDAVRAACDALTVQRAAMGWWYPVCSTALFGGVLPLAFQALSRGHAARDSWRRLPFFLVFWGAKGAELEAWYRLQAWVFGGEASAAIVAAKVAADQLLYAPFWAAPSMLMAYRWKDCRFDARGALRSIDRAWWRVVYVPAMLANWVLWVPAVTLIYCLPLPLQLPLQNLVLCFAVLIGALLARGDGARTLAA